MKKPFKVIDLYKAVGTGESLLPTGTDFDFWEGTYEANTAVYDREFARRFTTFEYFDFLDADTIAEARENFHADVLSILTFNQKRYAEMYRVFLVEDADDPITYNYDMIETTGAQHTETEYGATSETKGAETFTKGEETFTKGSQTITKGAETFTKGSQENIVGATTNTHSVAPYNVSTLTAESSDAVTAQTNTEGQREDTEGQRIDTDGQRIDTEGQRIDTNAARTDTALAHTDQTDTDEWTLTRRGNIGTQTAADILRLHTAYWTEQYKFMELIFNDIAKQLLMCGD